MSHNSWILLLVLALLSLHCTSGRGAQPARLDPAEALNHCETASDCVNSHISLGHCPELCTDRAGSLVHRDELSKIQAMDQKAWAKERRECEKLIETGKAKAGFCHMMACPKATCLPFARCTLKCVDSKCIRQDDC